MGRALVHDHLLVHSEVTVTSELHAEVDAAAAKNKDMEKRRLHPFEALTKTLKWRMELKNGGAPLVADEIGCGTDDLLQVEGGASGKIFGIDTSDSGASSPFYLRETYSSRSSQQYLS